MKRRRGTDRLHAFVDGQLGPADRARLLEEMGRNPALEREVSEMRRLKQYVASAFDDLPAAPARTRRGSTVWNLVGRSLAAMVLLGIGFLAGQWIDPTGGHVTIPEGKHVVFHVNESDAVKFLAVLKDAQAAAEEERAQVEVVTNAGGLDLLRSDRSPHAKEIRQLISRYPNLQFVACNITLKKQQGPTEPLLVEGIQIAPSAAEHILRRMEEGWSYVRV